MSEDREQPDLSWLTGRRIALVGKPGGVSRRQAMQLLKELGGVPAERYDTQTEVVVIGAEEGREAAVALLDVDAQARVAAGDLQLMHETCLLYTSPSPRDS